MVNEETFFWPSEVYAPNYIKQAGGGGGIQGMGIWHFSQICRQIPSQPGLHIVVHPKAGPKKGIIKISPNTTLQSINQSIY